MTRIYTLADVSSMLHNDYPSGASVSVANVDASMLAKIKKGQICVDFYTLVLIQKGRMSYALKGNVIELKENDLVLVPPNYPVSYDSYTDDLQSINLMIEERYYNKVLQFDPNLMDMEYSYAYDLLPVFHLEANKQMLFLDLSKQIQNTIRIPHLYREEMIDHLVHVVQLLFSELLYGGEIQPSHDLTNKQNIFKIFIHLASRNFKKERQIKFYADNLNITTTYLSRTVKEMSGQTVNGYLNTFLYNEICKLLRSSSYNMSEIADFLYFNDQSALTNFFKSRSGMTPGAYRRSFVGK
ncbi:MAG: AraC family transcriptional regulator [Prevotella sp.]|nr:AraC family transcriptional regulator [Prevotella sp.]